MEIAIAVKLQAELTRFKEKDREIQELLQKRQDLRKRVREISKRIDQLITEENLNPTSETAITKYRKEKQ